MPLGVGNRPKFLALSSQSGHRAPIPTAQPFDANIPLAKALSRFRSDITLIGSGDIVSPRVLDGMSKRDYVILEHVTNSAEALRSIHESGLLNRQSLALETGAPARPALPYLANDPSLIYFRPVERLEQMQEEAIYIAANPDAVWVFHQEERASGHGSVESYGRTAIAYSDYARMQASIPAGSSIHPTRRCVVDSQLLQNQGLHPYIGEVCADMGRIGPDMFIPTDRVADMLRAK